MSNRSLFVTFEGGEGAGKTTLIRNLEKELTKNGHAVSVTREPGGTQLGHQIRDMLLHQKDKISISPMAELNLFLADRAQHIEEFIKPALRDGKIVLCDRFNDSTIAYQGFGRGLGFEKVEQLCLGTCQGFLPELTFFLDLDPQIGFERTRLEQRVPDRLELEKQAFHDKVRQGFLTIAKKDAQRVVVLDASQTSEHVFKKALQVLESRL
jgi:dTMP kinase